MSVLRHWWLVKGEQEGCAGYHGQGCGGGIVRRPCWSGGGRVDFEGHGGGM